MINVLSSFLEFFEMLADQIYNLVSGVVSLIALIPPAVSAIDYSIAYMPAVLSTFAVAGVGICIVFHIIGR